MTIGSATSMAPMPTASSNTENIKAPVTPVQPTSSRDNEATEVSSADDKKGGIDTYA